MAARVMIAWLTVVRFMLPRAMALDKFEGRDAIKTKRSGRSIQQIMFTLFFLCVLRVLNYNNLQNSVRKA